jgi:hypothetical protein
MKLFALTHTNQGPPPFIQSCPFDILCHVNEIEQRHVIKFLYTKKFALDRIVAEFASVYGEQVSAKKSVGHWIHQAKLKRSDIEDEVKHGRLPLDDVDARILACLGHEPFSSTRSIAQALGLAPATVHRHLTISLDIQSRHFPWVVHVLTRELRDQWIKGARALLDVLRQQEKTHFQDTITGDELLIFMDTAPSSIWLSLDEQLPTRPWRTISADKRILIAFSGIKGLVHVNWLPKDVRINAIYFRDEIFPRSSKQIFQVDTNQEH